MSLTVFNGSPRGKNSNSSKMIEWFQNGYGTDSQKDYHYLNKINAMDGAVQSFESASEILCVFPLYVDGMPGQVKAFFEKLTHLKGKCQGKSIVFIIHSGFSEAIQNRALERYLNRLCAILAIENATVIIIPGSEGFRLMPDKWTQKKHDKVALMGKNFKEGKPLDSKALYALQKKETLSKFSILILRFFSLFGLTNMYWNQNLKANNAYDKRFDAPYKNGPVTADSKAFMTNR